MKTSNIIGSIFILSLTLTWKADAAEYVYYKLSSNEYISEVLNDLGVCPLYGQKGYLNKVLALNKSINPDKIIAGQMLKVPFSFIKDTDYIHFFPNQKVLPKSINNNICAKLKKKKVINKKIINLPELYEEVVFYPQEVESAIKHQNSEPLLIQSITQNSKNKNKFHISFNRPILTRGRPFLFIQLSKDKKYKAFYEDGDGTQQITFTIDQEVKWNDIHQVKVNIPRNFTDFEIVDFNDKILTIEKHMTIISKNGNTIKRSAL